MGEINYKNILSPVDFSEISTNALRSAVNLAKKFGSTLNLIHVIPRVRYSRTSYYDVDDKTDLANLCSKEIPKEINFKSEIIKNDDIDNGIDDYAKENAIDLIVLGTQGRTGLERVFLGSTAEEVVRRAPCDVLIVRLKEE